MLLGNLAFVKQDMAASSCSQRCARAIGLGLVHQLALGLVFAITIAITIAIVIVIVTVTVTVM